MNNSNALAEIQSKYPNCNLLLPAATSVQINPFYKCSVMEVVADTAPNSGDIFSVGKVKTGEDRDGKAVYEEVYSPAKPLLMKLATAAGIQFHPEYTTVTRENTNTYVWISHSWLSMTGEHPRPLLKCSRGNGSRRQNLISMESTTSTM